MNCFHFCELAVLPITGIGLADCDGVVTEGGGPDGGIGFFTFPALADADEPLKSEYEVDTEAIYMMCYFYIAFHIKQHE